MADRLVVISTVGGYRIAWDLDGEIGAIVGEYHSYAGGPPPTEREEWENWIADELASKSQPMLDAVGFCWDTREKAQAVLKQIRKAHQTNEGRVLPEWATKALAEGWTPPKGWKP